MADFHGAGDKLRAHQKASLLGAKQRSYEALLAARRHDLLPTIFYTTSAQETSMETSFRARLAVKEEEIAARERQTGRPEKYTAYAFVKKQVPVFRRKSNLTSWQLKDSESDVGFDAAAGAPADVGCTYKLRRDWAQFLDREALKDLISSMPACRIAFAMGCSATSRLSSGCPAGMRGLPQELMKKIFSFAFSTTLEVAFHPTVGCGIGTYPEHAMLTVGSRTIGLISDDEMYAGF